jgi:hypothetical protein
MITSADAIFWLKKLSSEQPINGSIRVIALDFSSENLISGTFLEK